MTKEQLEKWTKDALADGWKISPVYETESVEWAFRLKKDDFIVQALNRPARELKWGKFKPEVSVSIWGPDGLALNIPEVYCMEALINGLTICGYCGANGPTVRVNFAGRCCLKCRNDKDFIARHEPRGWCD